MEEFNKKLKEATELLKDVSKELNAPYVLDAINSFKEAHEKSIKQSEFLKDPYNPKNAGKIIVVD